jgi:hypothetical protein
MYFVILCGSMNYDLPQRPYETPASPTKSIKIRLSSRVNPYIGIRLTSNKQREAAFSNLPSTSKLPSPPVGSLKKSLTDPAPGTGETR